MDQGNAITSGQSYAQHNEINGYRKLVEALKNTPIPDSEILANLALFIPRAELARMIFIHELYRRVIDINGVIIEFGVRWGRNLALWTTCRSMYEPYNFGRRIVGFDTFEGFPSVSELDGDSKSASVGGFGVSLDYEETLAGILNAHEAIAPRSNIVKYNLVKGNIIETLPAFLDENPQIVIALAYIDVDLYEPTKLILETIVPYMSRGGIIGFDELNSTEFPGETIAAREALGLRSQRVRRYPFSSLQSYVVLD